jgi:hypothetical protein
LAFLRITRDKRGYETTSLVHAVRRQGRSKHRILYWFRTPPGVRVGRPALDEEAIRRIEEQNPDIQFDWQKILEAQPPAGQGDDAQSRRPRRERSDGRENRKAVRPPQEPAVGTPGTVETGEGEESVFVERAADFGPDEAEPDEVEEPGDAEIEIAADVAAANALEQLTHPDVEENPDAPVLPVAQTLGTEQLTRLRARYGEIQRRITERGGERVDQLRLQAESLNPDAWVTRDEIRAGLEEFENRMRELRGALGLRRRRRSHRGGRRTRPPQAAEGQ